MNRFQQGSLFKAKRKGCSDVWVFRWYDYSSGKRIYKKEIIGSVAQIRSKREAEKVAAALRSSINVDIGTPHTICDLAAHYRVHELTQEKKSFSTMDNHRILFKRYIEPRWGAFDLVPFDLHTDERPLMDECPLFLHRQCTRDEVLVGLGLPNLVGARQTQTGRLWIESSNTEIFS